MTVTKRTITVETRQRTVIRQTARQTPTIRCEFCTADVEMTSPNQAASLLGITEREIFRRLEQGNLHFFETETGEVFICAHPLDPA
jgi:hypothetical protein